MKSKTVREPIATWWKIALYDVQITPVKDVRDQLKVVWEKGMKP